MSLDDPSAADSYSKTVEPIRESVKDSWTGARKHPTLTVIGLFAGGLVGITLIMYLGPRGGALYPSVVTGIGCGLLLAVHGWRTIRDGVEARPLRPVTVFNLLTVGAGAALLAWGVAIFDWSLALSGLPLLALGAVLMVARHRLNPRRSRD